MARGEEVERQVWKMSSLESRANIRKFGAKIQPVQVAWGLVMFDKYKGICTLSCGNPSVFLNSNKT